MFHKNRKLTAHIRECSLLVRCYRTKTQLAATVLKSVLEGVPLPKVNQRYKNGREVLTIITSVEEAWVVLTWEGYPHPYMRPMYNSLGKFRPDLREETG